MIIKIDTDDIEEDKELIDVLQRKVIEKKTSEEIKNFARDVKGADIKSLQQIIIERGYPKFIYEFARDVKGADVKLLAHAIINADRRWEPISYYDEDDTYWEEDKEQIYYIYEFARDVKGADVNFLQDFLINYGETDYVFYKDIVLYNFARDVKGADTERLAESLYNNIDVMCDFAENIDGVNFETIENKIIGLIINDSELAEAEYVKSFITSAIRHEKNVNIEKFINAVAEAIEYLRKYEDESDYAKMIAEYTELLEWMKNINLEKPLELLRRDIYNSILK